MTDIVITTGNSDRICHYCGDHIVSGGCTIKTADDNYAVAHTICTTKIHKRPLLAYPKKIDYTVHNQPKPRQFAIKELHDAFSGGEQKAVAQSVTASATKSGRPLPKKGGKKRSR